MACLSFSRKYKAVITVYYKFDAKIVKLGSLQQAQKLSKKITNNEIFKLDRWLPRDFEDYDHSVHHNGFRMTSLFIKIRLHMVTQR